MSLSDGTLAKSLPQDPTTTKAQFGAVMSAEENVNRVEVQVYSYSQLLVVTP